LAPLSTLWHGIKQVLLAPNPLAILGLALLHFSGALLFWFWNPYKIRMVFYPPSWVPKLAQDPPDSIPLCDFIFDEKYGRFPLKDSRPFFTCGVSGQSYTPLELKERVEYLARGLADELGWQPNQGTEWDKVVGVFSANTVGNCFVYMPKPS
jgi:hypothetical protein